MTTSEAQAQTQHPLSAAPRHTRGALALQPGGWLPSLLIVVLAALLLLAADIALLHIHPGAYSIPVGNYRDKFFLERANFQEVAPDGTPYRWTTGTSTLWLNQIGVTRNAFLTLNLGGRPAGAQPVDLSLTINGQPWASVRAEMQPRRFALLLPPNPPAAMAIGLNSPTFSVPGDSRRLGVKIEGFTLGFAQDTLPLPTLPHYLAQIGVLLAAQLAAFRLRWRLRWQALLALVLALGLAALLSGELLLTYAYMPRLAIAAIALAALTWLLLPRAERALAWAGGPQEIRVLWALMLGACALRLAGVLYPTFAGQDLGLNLGRLFKTLVGQLIVIAGSSEFANGQTIYPPGPYLAALPGAILTADYGSLLQGVLAILDGSTALLIALVTRRLGGSRDAARIALLLYASSILAFSALQFGFSAQIFGQWFTAPLLLLLLVAAPPQPRTWLLATIILMFGLFSHIGVAILDVAWMGILLLLTLPRSWRSALWGIGLMGAGGLLALALLYVDIAALTLSHASGAVSDRSGSGLLGATPLLLKGALLAYSEVGLVLLPLGLLLILRAARGWGRQMVPLAMLLAALLFFAVDLLLAMQVRYFYFAMPLALAAIAIVLGRVATRGPAARLAIWALVLALVLSGAAAWYNAAFGEIQISMTPLTH